MTAFRPPHRPADPAPVGSFEELCVVCGDPDCFGPSGRHRVTAAHGREVDPEQVEKVARVLAELPFPDVSPMDYARAAVEAIAAYTGEVSGAWRCSRCSLAPESHAASECIYAPGWGAADTGEAQQAVEDVVVPSMPKSRRVLGRFRLDGAE